MKDLREAERHWFGLDHAALGQEVCEYWNFPELISTLVGAHHEPFLVPDEHRDVACVIRLADLVAAAMPDGFRLDHTSLDIDPEILDELQITPYHVAEFSERIRAEMHEVSSILG